MNSQTSINSASTVIPVKVFKYRWVILILYVLAGVINFMQLLQFSIIANIVTKFYNVEDYWVDLTGLIFFIAYIILFYPISFLIEKFNLKVTIISATALTLAGNLLKLLAAQPDRFWLVLLAQFIISVGQIYLSSIPSKLAMTWFGADEVSTACAIAVLGMQLGSALGCLQSPFAVTSGDNEDVQPQLFDMFLYQAIASACIFVLILTFFRSQPSLPPSQSQLNLIANSEILSATFFTNMKKIVRNKNFWFIVFSLGMANAVWNAFGILINNMYLNYFPNGASDAGLIALITIISGGCIGSLFFGIILDKTHLFKKVSFGILVAAALAYVLTIVAILEKSRLGTFIAIPIFGFLIAPALIIGFEFLVEVTYPIPESCSTSTFNAAFNFLSIVATLLFEGLFDLIGYMYTFVVIFFILSSCAMMVLFIDSDLKRRDANLREHETNGNIGNGFSTRSTSTISSTTVTVARF